MRRIFYSLLITISTIFGAAASVHPEPPSAWEYAPEELSDIVPAYVYLELDYIPARVPQLEGFYLLVEIDIASDPLIAHIVCIPENAYTRFLRERQFPTGLDSVSLEKSGSFWDGPANRKHMAVYVTEAGARIPLGTWYTNVVSHGMGRTGTSTTYIRLSEQFGGGIVDLKRFQRLIANNHTPANRSPYLLTGLIINSLIAYNPGDPKAGELARKWGNRLTGGGSAVLDAVGIAATLGVATPILADEFVANVRQAWTGEQTKSISQRSVENYAMAFGATEEEAELWGQGGRAVITAGADLYGSKKGFDLVEAMTRRKAARNAAQARRQALFSDGDPLADSLGAGLDSHPDQVGAMLDDFSAANVDVEFRANTMVYEPGLSVGEPGRIIMDPTASYGAWAHEYRHFLDDQASGFLGFQHMEDAQNFWRFEYRGYMQELNVARDNKLYDEGRRIIELARKRKRELLGN